MLFIHTVISISSMIIPTMSGVFFGKKTVFNNHRIPIDEFKQVYEKHEVAAHSVNHPILTQLSDDQVFKYFGIK